MIARHITVAIGSALAAILLATTGPSLSQEPEGRPPDWLSDLMTAEYIAQMGPLPRLDPHTNVRFLYPRALACALHGVSQFDTLVQLITEADAVSARALGPLLAATGHANAAREIRKRAAARTSKSDDSYLDPLEHAAATSEMVDRVAAAGDDDAPSEAEMDALISGDELGMAADTLGLRVRAVARGNPRCIAWILRAARNADHSSLEYLALAVRGQGVDAEFLRITCVSRPDRWLDSRWEDLLCALRSTDGIRTALDLWENDALESRHSLAVQTLRCLLGGPDLKEAPSVIRARIAPLLDTAKWNEKTCRFETPDALPLYPR